MLVSLSPTVHDHFGSRLVHGQRSHLREPGLSATLALMTCQPNYRSSARSSRGMTHFHRPPGWRADCAARHRLQSAADGRGEGSLFSVIDSKNADFCHQGVSLLLAVLNSRGPRRDVPVRVRDSLQAAQAQ